MDLSQSMKNAHVEKLENFKLMRNFEIRRNTPYSKMAAILVFFYLLAN